MCSTALSCWGSWASVKPCCTTSSSLGTNPVVLVLFFGPACCWFGQLATQGVLSEHRVEPIQAGDGERFGSRFSCRFVCFHRTLADLDMVDELLKRPLVEVGSPRRWPRHTPWPRGGCATHTGGALLADGIRLPGKRLQGRCLRRGFVNMRKALTCTFALPPSTFQLCGNGSQGASAAVALTLANILLEEPTCLIRTSVSLTPPI